MYGVSAASEGVGERRLTKKARFNGLSSVRHEIGFPQVTCPCVPRLRFPCDHELRHHHQFNGSPARGVESETVMMLDRRLVGWQLARSFVDR
jgi:hypothetical protein